jgi:serine O-acetyltransferase
VQALSFWVRISTAAPLLLAYWLTGARALIRADAERWMSISAEQEWKWLPHRRAKTVQLLYLLAYPRPFRSLFYYRTERGGMPGRVMAKALRVLYRGEVALELHAASIGPGLYIAHGFATIVVWNAVIGANCWLHQNVTIGWGSGDGAPHIGDDVTIYTGAVVIGEITVGDDVIVGANAVVAKDVPAGVVARGVPATYHPRAPT